MENPLPRSKTVAVTVASEQEPVTVDGELLQSDDGFVLKFSVSNDQFTVTHGSVFTRITAVGDMTYDIELTDGVTSTVLATPFGKVKFAVKTVVRDVTVGDDRIRISLKYILDGASVGEIERTVDISVRFFNSES